jgi:hypothetical protein
MSMFVDPATMGTAAKVATTLYANRNKIVTLTGKLRFWLTHGQLKIAVFGPGGAGKSTLGRLMSATDKTLLAPLPYEESLDEERYNLQGDFVGGLLVPPGQERRREDYWPELYRSLAQGKSQGIVNVVSWGYHAIQHYGYQEMTEYYKPGMTQQQFMVEYLGKRRDHELKLLKELVPRIEDAKRKIWMVTLVTKQDLWWKDRVQMEQHYQQGEYDKYIQVIAQKRGERQFRHEYLSASLVMSNFVSGRGELLSPTTEGYDQNIQLANLANLVEMIHTLAKR